MGQHCIVFLWTIVLHQLGHSLTQQPCSAIDIAHTHAHTLYSNIRYHNCTLTKERERERRHVDKSTLYTIYIRLLLHAACTSLTMPGATYMLQFDRLCASTPLGMPRNIWRGGHIQKVFAKPWLARRGPKQPGLELDNIVTSSNGTP